MTSPRDIGAKDYRALAEFRHQIRRFLNFSEAAARGTGIEPQQHQLLLVLKGLSSAERPTIRTIAERLQIQHNSAVELVRRSVLRGLVQRRTGREDRREASLHITPRGERVLRRLSVSHRDELRSAAPALVRSLEALVPRRQAKRRIKDREE
jgi:DNA-binding MarR family transcriptional regulator